MQGLLFAVPDNEGCNYSWKGYIRNVGMSGSTGICRNCGNIHGKENVRRVSVENLSKV